MDSVFIRALRDLTAVASVTQGDYFPLIPRARPRSLKSIVRAVAAAEQVDYRVLRALIRLESAGNVSARSSSGAAGLMQLLPAAMIDVYKANPNGVQWTQAGRMARPLDPEQNVVVGARYFKMKAREVGVDISDHPELFRAYIAYNIGFGSYRSLVRGRPVSEAVFSANAYGRRDVYVANVKDAWEQALS